MEQLWNTEREPEPTEHTRVLTLPNCNGEKINLPGLLSDLKPVCFFSGSNGHLYRNRNHLKKVINSYIPTVPYDKNESAF